MKNFPCSADLHFYESKNRPAWVARLNKRQQPQSPRDLIDSCVNAHGGIRISSTECTVNNLLFLVSCWIRRGENLSERLEQVAKNPECLIQPEQRAAFARKWARRIQETAR